MLQQDESKVRFIDTVSLARWSESNEGSCSR